MKGVIRRTIDNLVEPVLQAAVQITRRGHFTWGSFSELIHDGELGRVVDSYMQIHEMPTPSDVNFEGFTFHYRVTRDGVTVTIQSRSQRLHAHFDKAGNALNHQDLRRLEDYLIEQKERREPIVPVEDYMALAALPPRNDSHYYAMRESFHL